jgi:hypothetical protein
VRIRAQLINEVSPLGYVGRRRSDAPSHLCNTQALYSRYKEKARPEKDRARLGAMKREVIIASQVLAQVQTASCLHPTWTKRYHANQSGKYGKLSRAKLSRSQKSPGLSMLGMFFRQTIMLVSPGKEGQWLLVKLFVPLLMLPSGKRMLC